MIKLSDYIAKRLKEVYDIRDIFMISGGGAMHLNDSFGRYLNYICNHNEQASAIAAEGYSRVGQKLAVVNVTTGPGGLNCLNGVFGQWTDSVPVLYISGQVKCSTMMAKTEDKSLRQLGDQEVDIVNIVKPIVKYAKTVTNPEEIRYILDKAIFLALQGRKGPVWIDIPIDIQSTMIDENNLKEYDETEDTMVFDNNKLEKQMDGLSGLIKNAKKPLIIAGHGIRLAGAKDEFLNLIKKLNIPVVTTMNGFDLVSHDNPLFIGRIGTVGNRCANFALQNSDLVISMGSRNNIRQISYNWENFAKKAKLVLIDIDKSELDKPTLNPYLKIHSDCKIFIEKLNNLKNLSSKKSGWLNWCVEIKEKYPNIEIENISDKGIEPYNFMNKLSKELSENEIVITANGSAFVVYFQAGEVKKNQRYIWNSGDASMGYDLPAAIGACIASGGKRIVCIAGDGSMMMNLQELQTIKHYNLPIKIFLLNNSGYVSIRQTQNAFFNGRKTACCPQSGVSIPSFTDLSKAFGIKTMKIENENEIKARIIKTLEADEAVLCEVMLKTDYGFRPKLASKCLEDGTMISSSLENMYPFLDKTEIEKIMI